MQLTKKHFWLFIGSLLLVAALTFTLTFLFARKTEIKTVIEYTPVEYPAIEGVPDNYRELCAALRRYSYYGLPDDLDYAGLFARAIVASTGDPFAEYFTAEEYEDYLADLSGMIYGIGATVDAVTTEGGDPAIRLLAIFPDSGAEAAGLTRGDLIVAVGGESVQALGGVDEALDRIRGESGTAVTLTVLRDGTESVFNVTRGDCRKQTVYANHLELGDGKKVAYIRITAFNTVTLEEFISAVDAAEAAGVSGLVFDLRYNGGGYLSTVSQMLAYLLPDGAISHIRYGSEDLRDQDYDIVAEGGAITGLNGNIALTSAQISHEVTLPMTVLVNNLTASAAELFTSALRDYAASEAYPDFPEVAVVGSRTYGKGCMQNTFRLSDGSYLKVTVALYNPPFGENYHEMGIDPTPEYKTAASDTRVGDLYLKDTEGSTILPSGEFDTVLVRALQAFTH